MKEQELLHIINFGKALVEEYRENPEDNNIQTALLVLLHIERTLDKGRTLLTNPNPDMLSEINEGMNFIRGGIAKMIETLDKTIIKTIMSDEAEKFKTRHITT